MWTPPIFDVVYRFGLVALVVRRRASHPPWFLVCTVIVGGIVVGPFGV
jgi:hypothetical protein